MISGNNLPILNAVKITCYRWQYGIVVTLLGTSTKLLYVRGWVIVYGQVNISVCNSHRSQLKSSTRWGAVKWVSAFGLSNNNKCNMLLYFILYCNLCTINDSHAMWCNVNGNGGYGLLAAYTGGPVAQASWLGQKVGGHLAPCCIHHVNRVNSHNGCAMMTAL